MQRNEPRNSELLCQELLFKDGDVRLICSLWFYFIRCVDVQFVTVLVSHNMKYLHCDSSTKVRFQWKTLKTSALKSISQYNHWIFIC